MDVILRLHDEYVFDNVYNYLLPYPVKPQSLYMLNSTELPSSSHSSSTYPTIAPESLLPRDHMLRQSISLFTIALVGATILYFLFSSISYFCFFDKRLEHHPRFLKNQIRMEIKSSLIAMPCIDLMTLPWFLAECRGYSKLYENVDDYGWTYLFASIGLYLFFTDFTIYWIHRIEHHPRLYKHIHKPHHKWIGKCLCSLCSTYRARTWERHARRLVGIATMETS
jgi:lathosterol oxidase